jgi:hypothetical protein
MHFIYIGPHRTLFKRVYIKVCNVLKPYNKKPILYDIVPLKKSIDDVIKKGSSSKELDSK